MHLMIEAHHPSDIHFWKYAIKILQDRGHKVLLVARDRDVMIDLLKSYPWIRYEIATSLGRQNRFPLKEFLQRQWGIARRIMRFKPRVLGSISGSYTHSSLFFNVPNLVFSDSESQAFNHFISHPFATRIYTPDCYTKNLGGARVWRRYPGNHELAFLRPGQFVPNAEGIEEAIGAPVGEYVPIRLSAWNTLHDIGGKGIAEVIDSIIEKIQGAGFKPTIVAEENKLPEHLREFRCPLPADRYHDLLAHSAFVLTEGASTASEAACLGKYAIYVNPLHTGYLLHLESRYGLVKCFRSGKKAAAEVERFLANPISPQWLASKREALFRETIDVATFLADTFLREAGYRDRVI